MVYPIWSDCLELEYKFGKDFFAPIVPLTKIPTSKKILYDLGIYFLMVRTKFILADGTILDGIIVIDPWNKTLYDISLKIKGELIDIDALTLKFGTFKHDDLCRELRKTRRSLSNSLLLFNCV